MTLFNKIMAAVLVANFLAVICLNSAMKMESDNVTITFGTAANAYNLPLSKLTASAVMEPRK